MTPGIVAESDLVGHLKSEYVFFNGERVARRDFDASTGAATGVFYYFSDHLKTASVITDATGNIQAESDYYPWGGELQLVNNDSNHYKFTGKERDSESGLDYFGARYYSNGLGRFITPDWAAKATAVPYAEFADPQSLNLYSYVRNIPEVEADADGHCSGIACVMEIVEIANRVAENPGAFVKSFLSGAVKQASANFRENWDMTPNASSEPSNDVERAGGAAFNGGITALAVTVPLIGGAKGSDAAVEPYEVGTYGELSARSKGDGLSIDHIPPNASNLARAAAEKGAPLTPAEKAAVRDQGTAVAVPDAAHRSASPTYGGRNTQTQIRMDATNPQAAAARDTQAMVDAASAVNRAAAEAAAAKIKAGADQ